MRTPKTSKKRAKKKSKKPTAEYDFLSLEVCSYKVRVDAAINYRVRNPKHCDEGTEVFAFYSSVEIECRCVWPENRAGDDYHLTVYGHELAHAPFSTTLADCHARNEFGERQYKKRRGERVPVYDVPKGIGFLDKVRGNRAWAGVAWVSKHCLTDMLALLPVVSPLYVSLHEMREGRSRSIAGLSLQNTDPAEE